MVRPDRLRDRSDPDLRGGRVGDRIEAVASTLNAFPSLFYITSVRDFTLRPTHAYSAARSESFGSLIWRFRWTSNSAPRTRRSAPSSAAGYLQICPKRAKRKRAW